MAACMKIRRIDFSPDEWLAGTVGLDNATRGLYITACALIYSHAGPIPEVELRRACCDHGHAYKRQLHCLIDGGKLIANDGQIDNKRCANELQKARKRYEKRAQIEDESSKINGVEPLAGASARTPRRNHQPSTIREKKEPVGSSFPPDLPRDADASLSLTAGAARLREFDEWWRAYPRKVGKQAARRKYEAARAAGAAADELLAGAERYAGAAIDADPQYVAHPATWLHQGRWQDEDVGIAPRKRSPVENLFLGAMRAADEYTERQEQSRNNGEDRSSTHPLLDR